MGSSTKRRTTMSKLQRENRLAERRMERAVRKQARKARAAEDPTPFAVDAVPEADGPGPLDH